jgi:hypothetical protein
MKDRAAFVTPFCFTANQVAELTRILGRRDRNAPTLIARTADHVAAFRSMRDMVRRDRVLPPSEVRMHYKRIAALSGKLAREVDRLDPLAGAPDVWQALDQLHQPQNFLERLGDDLLLLQAIMNKLQDNLVGLRPGSQSESTRLWFIDKIVLEYRAIYGKVPPKSRDTRFPKYMDQVMKYAFPKDRDWRRGCLRLLQKAVERVAALPLPPRLTAPPDSGDDAAT